MKYIILFSLFFLSACDEPLSHTIEEAKIKDKDLEVCTKDYSERIKEGIWINPNIDKNMEYHSKYETSFMIVPGGYIVRINHSIRNSFCYMVFVPGNIPENWRKCD